MRSPNRQLGVAPDRASPDGGGRGYRLIVLSAARFIILQPHRQPPSTPLARRAIDDSGHLRPAMLAMPVVIQRPGTQLIPIALDKAGPAARAIGARSLGVVDIADVGVPEAVLLGDRARPQKRCVGCARMIPHFPVRVKRRKMQRYVNAKVLGNPSA